MALSFAGNGTITGLSVGGLPDGVVDEDCLANNAVGSGKLASGVGGKILQVVSSTKTDSATTNSTSFVNSGLQVIITPSATSSKIFLMITLGAVGVQTVDERVFFQLTGGNTASYIGDAGTGHEAAFSWTPRGNDTYAMNTIVGSYLDSPSTTSAVTYTLQWKTTSSASSFTLNKPYTLDHNGSNNASTMTAFEISA